MDLSFTEMQKMLRNTARDFLKNECPWKVVQEIDDSETGFSEELWRKIAELGWLGMDFPEAYGGMGASLTDMSVIYEEMGNALMPGPHLTSAMLCGAIILETGNEEQKQQLLPEIAKGNKILTLALTEPDYGWAPECIHLTAMAKNGNFVLNGTKRYVHDAQIADQIICVARTSESENPEEGITLFLVEKESSGLSIRNLSGFVGEKLNEMTFNNVEVPASNVLGEVDNAWPALNKPLNRATLILCSYMVGASQHLLDMTIAYAQQRVQFGRPIATISYGGAVSACPNRPASRSGLGFYVGRPADLF